MENYIDEGKKYFQKGIPLKIMNMEWTAHADVMWIPSVKQV
jgi:hypothetical protein